MEGYRVVTMDYAADKADIFVTATGNYHVITHEHMQRMKDQRHRLQHRPLRQRNRRRGAQAAQVGKHQAAGRPRDLPGRQAHHPARRGAARESRLRHRAPELRDELLVREPDDRADRAVHAHGKYPVGVYVLPKHLDEKVARLQLTKLERRAHRADRRAGRATSAWTRPGPTSPITTATDGPVCGPGRQRRGTGRGAPAAHRRRRDPAGRQGGRRARARRGCRARAGVCRPAWPSAGAGGGAGGGARGIDCVRAQQAPLLARGRHRVVRARSARKCRRGADPGAR